MAKEYVPIYFDWTKVTEELNDQEKGRLIDAIVLYAAGGDWQERIKGNERYLFPAFREQINRNDEISQKRAEAGATGGAAKPTKPEQREANGSKNKQTEAKNSNPKQREAKKPKEEEKEEEKYIDSDDDDDNSGAGARASVVSAYLKHVGRRPTEAETASIALAASIQRFTGEMIDLAIRIAAERGAGSPAEYAKAILGEWYDEEVTTPEEYEEYRFLKDAAEGRNDYGGDGAMARMMAAYTMRKQKHQQAARQAEEGTA